MPFGFPAILAAERSRENLERCAFGISLHSFVLQQRAGQPASVPPDFLPIAPPRGHTKFAAVPAYTLMHAIVPRLHVRTLMPDTRKVNL